MRYRLKKFAVLSVYPSAGDPMAYLPPHPYERGAEFVFIGADLDYVFLRDGCLTANVSRKRFDEIFELCDGSILEEKWRSQ